MKNAHINVHIIEEQIHHHKKQIPQEQSLHLSLPPPLLLLPPEQQQQQQQLVLENISPIWALRLKKENLPTFMSLTWWKWHYELQKASKCVVGEAYGYSSQYTDDCSKCDRIGCKFLYYFTLNWRGKLESNKQDFVKHWNEEHNKGISLLLGHAEKFAEMT
jgi:hypothetical protein